MSSMDIGLSSILANIEFSVGLITEQTSFYMQMIKTETEISTSNCMMDLLLPLLKLLYQHIHPLYEEGCG